MYSGFTLALRGAILALGATLPVAGAEEAVLQAWVGWDMGTGKPAVNSIRVSWVWVQCKFLAPMATPYPLLWCHRFLWHQGFDRQLFRACPSFYFLIWCNFDAI